MSDQLTDPQRPRISARVGGIAESATLAIDAKAKALAAQGNDVVVFGAGEPDFPTPQAIVEAAAEACRDPKNHRYTPVAGLPELREAVAAKTARDSGYAVDASQVLVTNGGKQALYNTFAALLDPGDEVLVPAPYWVTYPESIRLAGGIPVVIETSEESGYRVSVEQLEEKLTAKTKVLLFVSPSNPTGAVYPPEAVAEVGHWAASKGIWVVTDEIYEHLVYGEAHHVSMPVVVPEIADRCVVVNGVAKTYAMTGWRVGWTIAPTDFTKAAANLQSHATSNVCNIAQRAAIEALTGDLKAVEEMRNAFDRRRRLAVSMLSAIPGVVCPEPEGAFYVFPSFRGVIGQRIGSVVVQSSLHLAEILLEESNVAIVPGEAFGAPGYARLSYATSDEKVEEGISRIGKLLS